jgi:hypothetical protein
MRLKIISGYSPPSQLSINNHQEWLNSQSTILNTYAKKLEGFDNDGVEKGESLPKQQQKETRQTEEEEVEQKRCHTKAPQESKRGHKKVHALC